MAYILNVTDTDEATAATYTVSLGAHATGDLLLVCLTQDGGGTTIAQSGGSDWTFLGTQAASGGCRQAWAYKIATSGSETNPTFAGANDEWLGTCLVIRDAHATEPFGATPTDGVDFVRTDWNNVGSSASGSLTTAVDECLLIYSWGTDGAQDMRTLLNEACGVDWADGTTINAIIAAKQQYTAGAASTVTMYNTAATEGGNGWVLAVRNKSGGILEPTIQPDINELYWYGVWPDKGTAAVTFQAPSAFAATINGISTSSVAPAAGNTTYADINGRAVDLASVESTTGLWVGGTHTIPSTDMSDSIIRHLWQMTVAGNSVNVGDGGVITCFSDGTNWACYQVGNKKTYWSGLLTEAAYIDPVNATPYATSGSINWAAVTRVGYFYHRRGSTATSIALRIARLSLVDGPDVIFGGGAASPVTFANYHNRMHVWSEYGFSIRQAGAQYRLSQAIVIGNGTNETYFSGELTSIEYPRAWGVSSQVFWNMGENAVGIGINASAADTIIFSNGLAYTGTKQALYLDAASDTSANYNFSQTYSGFDVDWKTGIACNAVVFAACHKTDLKGTTASGCTWTKSQASDAACLLSVDGGSITDSTFTKGDEDYAVEISAAGDYVLEGTTYTGYTKEIYVSASSGTVTITILSSDAVPDYDSDGATVVINQPYTSQASITNLEAGSRVYIYNVTAATEIYNDVVAGTSYSQGYNDGTDYTDGDVVEVRIAWSSGASAKLPVSYFTVASATGWAVLAQQTDDDVYNTNAIDGDTVTEFVADYPNVQVDIDDPDGVTTVQRGYAWYISGQMTEDGIRYYHGAMTAEDAYNYRINVDVADMRIQNIDTDPVQVLGGRLYRSDGTRVTESGSGPIEMEYGRAYIASGSGTCPTASENAAAVRAELATELAHMDAPISDVPAEVLAAAQVAPIQATSQARVLEGTITEAAAQRIVLAALAGKRQGLGTATEEYLGQDGVTPRITFTPTDASGNGDTVVDGA